MKSIFKKYDFGVKDSIVKVFFVKDKNCDDFLFKKKYKKEKKVDRKKNKFKSKLKVWF